MLKKISILLSVTTIIIALYGLLSQDFRFLALVFFLAGLSQLLNGFVEFTKNKRLEGWLLIVSSGIVLFISIYIFLF
ncbi:Protein of unknown function [Marinilactibacillus piezotolerans]|uniref:DUF3953 domain-containing protein n=1 Tax=Marinilactibacillus piezotolerans TaxID=258723 RepID=A0A1I3VVT4_9LACT|nr:DUF3953 domain-containing protein [Marinilactibacillus piezotolerans]SFJ99249.1 Protein of unknown function [Marinilactibacillus piezotolerans]